MSDDKKRKRDMSDGKTDMSDRGDMLAVRTQFVPCSDSEHLAVSKKVVPCWKKQKEPGIKIKEMDDKYIDMLQKALASRSPHPVLKQPLNQGNTNACTRMALAYVILATSKAMLGVDMDVTTIATTITCASPCVKTSQVCIERLFRDWKTKGKETGFGFWDEKKSVWFTAPISYFRELTFENAWTQQYRLQHTSECIIVIQRGKHYDEELRVDHAMVGVAVRCLNGRRVIICANTYGSEDRFVPIREEDMVRAYQVEIDVEECFSDGKWTPHKEPPILSTWVETLEREDRHRMHYRRHGRY